MKAGICTLALITLTPLAMIACAPANHSNHSHDTVAVQGEQIVTRAILQKQSPHSFEQTVARVREEIGKRPLNLFAEVPHSVGAQKAGLELAPSTLFIFGNPKGGTPLMARNPEMGIELPLKIHVFQTDTGVTVNYTDIASTVSAHGGDASALPTPKIAEMLEGLVGAVIAK